MSDKKTFSDYEQMFINKNKDTTISELMDACSAPDAYPNVAPYSHRGVHYATIRHSSLDSLLFRLRKDFYDFALKEEGFLNLPILGIFYDEDRDLITYVVEKLFDLEDFSMYRAIYFDAFDGCFVTNSYGLTTKNYRDEVIPCQNYNVIGDLYLKVKGYFED